MQILKTFARNMALQKKLGQQTANVAKRRFKQVVLTSETAWRDAERRARTRRYKQRREKCKFDMENDLMTDVQRQARQEWRDFRTECVQCKDGWRQNADNNPVDPGSDLCEKEPKCSGDKIPNPFYESTDDQDCIMTCDPRFEVNIHVLKAKGCVEDSYVNPDPDTANECVTFCSSSHNNFMVNYVNIAENPNHFVCPKGIPTRKDHPTDAKDELSYCQSCNPWDKPITNDETGVFECAPVCVNEAGTPTGYYESTKDSQSDDAFEGSLDTWWKKLNRRANDQGKINMMTKMMLASLPACQPLCPTGYRPKLP